MTITLCYFSNYDTYDARQLHFVLRGGFEKILRVLESPHWIFISERSGPLFINCRVFIIVVIILSVCVCDFISVHKRPSDVCQLPLAPPRRRPAEGRDADVPRMSMRDQPYTVQSQPCRREGNLRAAGTVSVLCTLTATLAASATWGRDVPGEVCLSPPLVYVCSAHREGLCVFVPALTMSGLRASRLPMSLQSERCRRCRHVSVHDVSCGSSAGSLVYRSCRLPTLLWSAFGRRTTFRLLSMFASVLLRFWYLFLREKKISEKRRGRKSSRRTFSSVYSACHFRLTRNS